MVLRFNSTHKSQPRLMNLAHPTYYLDYASPLGAVRLHAHAHAVFAVYFHSEEHALEQGHHTSTLVTPATPQRAYFNDVLHWLDHYFKTPASLPPPPICIEPLAGTPFQKKVWHALCSIPPGQTISYSELARRCGHPRAVRAVASACGKNPCLILIPCHRVITQTGALGGYSGGLKRKQHLLQWERCSPA